MKEKLRNIKNKFKRETLIDSTNTETIEKITNNAEYNENIEYNISNIEAGFAKGLIKKGKLVELRLTPRGEEEFIEDDYNPLERLSSKEIIEAKLNMIDLTGEKPREFRRYTIPIPTKNGYFLMECT